MLLLKLFWAIAVNFICALRVDPKQKKEEKNENKALKKICKLLFVTEVLDDDSLNISGVFPNEEKK